MMTENINTFVKFENHKAAEALWLMIKDDSAGVNDFDKLAKEWSAMVAQRGTLNEDAARYIVFLRTSRISEAAFQWHPTFFKILFSEYGCQVQVFPKIKYKCFLK